MAHMALGARLLRQELIRGAVDSIQAPFPLGAGDLDVFARYVITNRAFLFKRAIDSSVLQHALAKLISLQPYISGRLTGHGDGIYSVDCNNAGVLLTEIDWQQGSAPGFLPAVAKWDTAHQLPAFTEEPPWHDSIDIAALLAGEEPLMKLRLTHLGDGGCILGICNSHMLYAGAGVAQLAVRLAALCRGEELPHIPPENRLQMWPKALLDRALATMGPDALRGLKDVKVRGPPEVLQKIAAGWQGPSSSPAAQPGPPVGNALGQSRPTPAEGEAAVVLRAFAAYNCLQSQPGGFRRCLLHVPGRELQRLRGHIQSGLVRPEGSTSSPAQCSGLSTNDVAAALLWMLMARSQGMAFPEQPGHPGTTLMITADLLRNGYPPEALPAHAGGNFVALLPCTSQPGTNGSADGTDAGELDASKLESLLSKIAQQIRLGLTTFRADPTLPISKALATADSIQAEAIEQQGAQMEPPMLAMSTSWRFVPMQLLDFGSGTPTVMVGHWQPWTADWPLLLPGPDGDGMIIQMVLQPEQLDAALAGNWLSRLSPDCKML